MMKRALFATLPWILLMALAMAEYNLDITPRPTLTHTPGPTETPCALCTPISTPTLEPPSTDVPSIGYPPYPTYEPLPQGYPGMVWLPIIVAPPSPMFPRTPYPYP